MSKHNQNLRQHPPPPLRYLPQSILLYLQRHSLHNPLILLLLLMIMIILYHKAHHLKLLAINKILTFLIKFLQIVYTPIYTFHIILLLQIVPRHLNFSQMELITKLTKFLFKIFSQNLIWFELRNHTVTFNKSVNNALFIVRIDLSEVLFIQLILPIFVVCLREVV